jgi:hypothetical protein
MSNNTQNQNQKFDEAISSPESKLALEEMVQKAKQDKIVESTVIQVPKNLFDDLEEL